MSALPNVEFTESGEALGRWWTFENDGRILCQLCPRACRLKEGDRGFCFVRVRRGDRMVLDTYGRSTGFCIDPIEKKPLNHFLPGTPVLSFGTAGCNLGCKFCQNWDISKSREVSKLSDVASPMGIAQAAKSHGCRSVAFTYNDPVIWAEYAIDAAAACRAEGIKTVAVTAGYITEQARGEFFDAMDAANIDLKGFTEDFYYRTTGAHLDPVLDTIRYACRETDCWVELTNLIIPDANDQPDELRRMCDWILETVGDEVPVHFTAFHPDFRMNDRPRTPIETLLRAYDLAHQVGLRYVYIGNVHDVARQSTYCPSCRGLLIERNWHQLGRYSMNENRCGHCGHEIAGCFETRPGDWGQRRQPIRIVEPDVVSPVIPPPRQQDALMQETSPAQDFVFTSQEQTLIHQAACRVVFAASHQVPATGIEEILGDLASRSVAGVYVTAKRGETLRGCCGLQGPPVELGAALIDAATRTAREDPRMPPISPVELPYLSISISVIGPPRRIAEQGDARIGAVEVGKQGLRIRKGKNVGLLLPVVARERHWDAREFLDAVCRKAGLPPAAWREDDAEVSVFDGVDFGAPFSDALEFDVSKEPVVLDPQELDELSGWVRHNVNAIQEGATPLFYCANAKDGNVLGVTVSITSDQGETANWMRVSLLKGIPLQTTLYEMAQTVAAEASRFGSARSWKISLGVLTHFVHHGSDQDAQFDGVDCERRAIVVLDQRRCTIGLDRTSTPEALLRTTLGEQSFRTGAAQVYSAVCDSTDSSFLVSMGPRSEPTITARPPGVAGGFYPASDEDRERMVDRLLDGLPSVQRREVAAAMVPHAGLRFSGRIAADVWRRIELPRDVLIIGPKHTPDGADWAVAPHDCWWLSGTARMNGAADLAEQIAAAIPGMELDAAAHRREHGIEVQLPLLLRLSPETRVAAIAMAGGSLAELESAASALAKWMSGLESPPLLVISSDMNHFADDAENRRRDALALEALQRNDPAGLLKICEQESISMCGQLPAALVLLTLRELGRKVNYDLVGYATSGDVTGGRDRVVGYAGVLF